MKSSYHSAEKQSEHNSNSSTSKGISARAVPVLQKAASVEEEPLQAKPAQSLHSPVVQQAKGDKGSEVVSPNGTVRRGRGILSLAPLLADRARGGGIRSLLPLPGAGGGGQAPLAPVQGGAGPAPSGSSPSSTPVIDSGSSGAGPAPSDAPPLRGLLDLPSGSGGSPSSTPVTASGPAPSDAPPLRGLAAMVAALDEREADARAQDGDEYQVDPTTALTQGAINDGAFAEIEGREGLPIPDYELTTEIDGVSYKFHIHGPANSDNSPGGGQIMVWSNRERRYVMTQKTTSASTIKAITDKFGWPAGWPRKPGQGGGGGGSAGGAGGGSASAPVS